jgi:hypothetical protein
MILCVMKLSVLFRGDSAVLKGNFLLITVSWIILFAAQPIPDTYASLFYHLYFCFLESLRAQH